MIGQSDNTVVNEGVRRRGRIIAALLVIFAAVALINVSFKMKDFYRRVTHPVMYGEYIEKYAKQYSVPEEIIYAVINTESSFDSSAESWAGAMGLMQLTKETFWWLLSKEGEDIAVEQLYDPETSIHYGTYFLSLLYNEFGSWDTSFAAYNAGRSCVNKWLQDENVTKDGVLIDIPYPETAQYVKRVSKNINEYRKLLRE